MVIATGRVNTYCSVQIRGRCRSCARSLESRIEGLTGQIETLEERVQSIRPSRGFTRCCSAGSREAVLLLAGIGLYGVMSLLATRGPAISQCRWR
jgi:hypothetical protein